MPSWLFVATLPNAGSTALAKVLATAPRAVLLNERGEGQWLVPEMRAPGRRWQPDTLIDLGEVRRVWVSEATRLGGDHAVVVEKSPPNIVRMRAILKAFDDMPTTVVRLTRDPYAVCSSWAARYSPAEIGRQWDRSLRGSLSTEDDFYRALGRICGERMSVLLGLSDLSALDLSYERLTADPGGAIADVVAVCPALEGADATASVAVKDREATPLRNMNEEQIGLLTQSQIGALTEGLEPYESEIASFGYRLAG